MGRRAKKAPVQTKKRPKLAKRFKCPFCANEDTVECTMDFRAGLGSLNCRLCAASYQMPIHHLHEPIDVFSEWLDDCEAAANPQQQRAGLSHEDDDDDDVPEASGLGAAGSKKKSQNERTYVDLGLADSDDDDDDE